MTSVGNLICNRVTLAEVNSAFGGTDSFVTAEPVASVDVGGCLYTDSAGNYFRIAQEYPTPAEVYASRRQPSRFTRTRWEDSPN
jgi:hypothetical protein